MTDTVRYLGPPPPDHLDEPPYDDEGGYQPPDPDRTTPPPHVLAERAVLGACLLDKHAIADTSEILTPDRFYEPRHELIYDAILHLYARGLPVEPLTVADHIGKDIRRAGGLPYILDLPMAPGAMVTGSASYHAAIVDRAHATRALTNAGTRIQALAATDAPLDDLLQAATDELAAIPRGVPGVDAPSMPGETLDELLAGDDPEYDWLIPGFLERRDRFVLTGGEGAGKSTLLRQLAVQAASGIHPFTLAHVEPIRVLVVDLENSRKQNRRAYRSLRFAAAARFDTSRLIVHSKLDGLDLTTTTDEAWLDRMITHHRPDLLVTGPIYKLAGGNPNDEVDAKPAAMALDRLRDKHGIALLLEAHSRKGESPKSRPKEPFGWSGWMRWPEFGFHIAAEGDLTPWRGQRDADREIPTYLKRGGLWPWNPATSLAEQQWFAIREIARAAGQRLSGRQMAERMGFSEKTYRNHIAGHEIELEQIWCQIEGEM